VRAARHTEVTVALPAPTRSRMRALAHLVRSPPFPMPTSSTLPEPPFGGRLEGVESAFDAEPPARTGWANRVINTDLIQLLKFFKPMMGDSNL
jgi:hypothetical protein